MKGPQTLRARIILFFCGYMTVLLTIYSGTSIVMFRTAEDMAFNRQLSEISAGIARHVEVHGEIPDVLPMHTSAYLDLARVPPHLQKDIKDHTPGVFEIQGHKFSTHAAIIPIFSTGKTLYVLYDVESIESSEELESIIIIFMVILGLSIVFLGWILARSLANRILTPVSELATAVQTLPMNADGVELRFNPTPDEVGTLGKTITHLLKRISEFTRREREFTAHASHELRTPVTVIKGAMEILKGRSEEGQTAIRDPLARIERAVTDIELLIDTFLMLARQRQTPKQDEPCDVQEIINRIVSTNQYLLATKPVEVEVRTEEAEPLQAPVSVVTIALGNLIRNAFQYTMDGKIEIIVFSDRVSIIDNGPGINASRKSGGLGLTIVERLCEYMGWRFVIAGVPRKGTQVDLVFI
jgi:signal transduction histidine kinase